MELISRPNYYSKVDKLLGTGILIVLTSQRHRENSRKLGLSASHPAGDKVNVGQMYATEIDFVGTKGDDTIYVQASYLITEESTFDRKFGNLQKITDNYPKYVISTTPFMDSSRYEGIIHIPLAEFLKKGFRDE